METFFQEGDEQINGDGTPDLGAHGVGACAIKGFDSEMLLDPFEEQLDLPATVIQLRDSQRGCGEVVGQKDQSLARFEIAIADASQRRGIIVLSQPARRDDRLVKAQAGGFVHGTGVAADEAEVFLGARNEEGGTLMQAVQSGEVEIPAIHDVERAGFPSELVEDVHVVNAARGDNDDGGKVAVESQQCVEFDGGLVLTELGPREQRETEVNGGGVQCVGGGFEFGEEGVFGVKRGGLSDEDLGEVGKDTPITLFVGIGQRAAGGGLAETGVIKFWTEGGQTGFDVTETFAPSELGEREHEEVFVGRKFADEMIAVITSDTLVELVFGEEVQELGEDGATFVHKVKPQECGKPPSKNRRRIEIEKNGNSRISPVLQG